MAEDDLSGLGKGAEAANKELLSNRETMRLLGEDFGFRLPRSVSGGIAQMLPDIASLGTALIGVFAVEKIGEWTKEGLTKLHEMYTEVDTDIKTLDAAGAAALKHIGAEADSMLTHFKTSLAGEFNIAEIDARAAQLERYHKAFAAWSKEGQSSVVELARQTPETIQAIAEAEREGLQSLAAVDEKLTEIGALQFAAHKHMAEVTQKEAHDFCNVAKHDQEEAARAARAVIEALHMEWEAEKQIHEWRAKAVAEAGKQLDLDDRAKQAAAEHQEFLAKQQLLDLEIKLSNVNQITYGQLRMLVPEITTEANATQHLSAERRMLISITQELNQKEIDHAKAMESVAEAQIKTMGAEIAGFIGAIAGRKAQAEVEGAFYLAEGGFDFARGFFPPNPALIARGLGEIGAGIDMLKVAGKSGSRSSAGGGGGGGGSREDYRHAGGYGSEHGEWPPPQTLAPGAAGAGGRWGSGSGVVIIHGEDAFVRYTARAVNAAHAQGIGMTVNYASRGTPVGH